MTTRPRAAPAAIHAPRPAHDGRVREPACMARTRSTVPVASHVQAAAGGAQVLGAASDLAGLAERRVTTDNTRPIARRPPAQVCGQLALSPLHPSASGVNNGKCLGSSTPSSYVGHGVAAQAPWLGSNESAPPTRKGCSASTGRRTHRNRPWCSRRSKSMPPSPVCWPSGRRPRHRRRYVSGAREQPRRARGHGACRRQKSMVLAMSCGVMSWPVFGTIPSSPADRAR
jgi:hypothetical protein